ncbi:hypothetical protein [Actinomadura sp. 21ATH]|uniref:hypothetical protein n=1 Tax=Actinomadura sp. 21ATH TaxID=1735444 RepID=UPI0035BFF1FD
MRDVQIATAGSSVGRNTTLAFSPGLAVTLAAPDWRRAPNTTVAGRPAFQRSEPARDRRPTAPLT